MTKIYRKTAAIKAEQFDGSQASLFGYEVMPDSLLDALTGEPAYYSILIDDFEPEPDDFEDDNEVSFEIGDWIVNETDEIEVIADDVFKKTYAELPVIPNYVAEYIDTEKNNTDVIQAGIDAIEYSKGSIELTTWIEENGDAFARAWLDGYQVED